MFADDIAASMRPVPYTRFRRTIPLIIFQKDCCLFSTDLDQNKDCFTQNISQIMYNLSFTILIRLCPNAKYISIIVCIYIMVFQVEAITTLLLCIRSQGNGHTDTELSGSVFTKLKVSDSTCWS